MKSDPLKIAEWKERSRQRQRDKPATPRAALRKTVIRKVSARQKARNITYSALVAEFKRQNPLCARCSAAGRETPTIDNHHMRGKEGERLNDVRFWMPLCRPCHEWATAHPADAKAAGWSVSRIAIIPGGDA